MGLNKFRDEAASFLRDIGKLDEPTSVKVGFLEQELNILRTSLDDPDKVRHQVYDLLFLLFELASQQGIDLDLEWDTGRKVKTKKYANSESRDSVIRYNKLVRDRIPEICSEAGLVPVTRQLTENEFDSFLALKLKDESEEYLESRDINELADVLEVVEAITNLHSAKNIVNNEKLQKRYERGGFDKRILLLETRKRV